MAGGESSTEQRINTEARLVFLLQKKLSKTDVCTKRKEILLPSRAARNKLPPVMAPNYCITLPVRDLKTGQTWTFKYKFWPRGSGSYLLANTVHFVDQHKLEAGDMIKLHKGLPDNQLVIEAVKLGQGSRGPTVPPATIARRSQTVRIRSSRKSPNNEVLPHGFI